MGRHPRGDTGEEAVSGPAVVGQRFSRWRFVAMLQASEMIAIGTAAVIALAVARHQNALPAPTNRECLGFIILIVVVVQCVLHSLDLYRFDTISQPIRSVTMAVFAWSIAMGPLLLQAQTRDLSGQGARFWVVTWSTIGIVAIGSLRAFAALAAAHLHRAGRLGHSVCIIGTGSEARSCALELRRQCVGVVLVGYFSPVAEEAEQAQPQYLGDLTDLADFLASQRVDEILVATRSDLAPLVDSLRCLPVRVSLLPSALDMTPSWVLRGDDNLGKTPLFRVNIRPLEGWRWVLKDTQDRLLALLLLLLFGPLLLIIAAAIRLSSPGPAIFRQTREGYAGRTFRIFKFRTMHAADCIATDSLPSATRGDPRIFPLGALLRRTSLDELPQLLNVLLGDMWLVGPRPHSPLSKAAGKYFTDAVALYKSRYRVKPGMTGWAQVNGWRGSIDTIEQIEQRVLHDLYYIENWSVLLDLQILIRTGWGGFVHQNAY